MTSSRLIRTTGAMLAVLGTAGLGALVARGPGTADTALWVTMLVTLGASVVRFALFNARAARPRQALPPASMRRSYMGIVVVADGHDERTLRATVLAARSTLGVVDVRLAAVGDQSAAEAVSTSLDVVRVEASNRAAAVTAAIADLQADFVAVFDGAESVFPDLVAQVGRWFADDRIAMVRCTVSESEEVEGLDLAVAFGDSSAGVALAQETAWVARRDAVIRAGGIRTDRDGGVLALVAALHHAGLRTAFHPIPIAAGTGAPNLDTRLALAARRTGLLIRVVLSNGGPLRARRHPLASRIAFLSELVEVATGPLAVVTAVGTIAALLTGRLPLTGSPLVVAGAGVLWFTGTALCRRAVGGPVARIGRLGRDTAELIGVRIRSLGRALVGQVAAVGRTEHAETGGVAVISRLRLATALTFSLDLALLARALARRVDGLLPAVSVAAFALVLLAGLAQVAQLLGGLRLLVQQRQRRTSMRVPVLIAARLAETEVQIVDLTPDGVGFTRNHRLAEGARVRVRVALPNLDGSSTDIAIDGPVASCNVRADGSFRIGMSIERVTPDGTDALLVYCTRTHPFLLARGQKTSTTHAPVAATVRRAPSSSAAPAPSGRPVMRIVSLLTMLGIGAASLPPYDAANAAPPAGSAVSGVVFQDHDANGKRDAGSSTTAVDQGVGGVTVTAFGPAGTSVGTTKSNADGTWTISGLSGALRIEFTNLPKGFKAGPVGADSHSLVQFANAGATGVSVGINIPSDYCQDNPLLAMSCFTFGDQVRGAYGSESVLKTFTYGATGSTFDGTATEKTTSAATAKQIGATWGLAYDRIGRKLVVGAFHKRYSGYGPGGPGAIYSVDPSGGQVSVLATLSAGTDPRSAFKVNTTSNLGDWMNSSVNDNTWDLVGKTSLGDLDLSEDGRTIYVVNLATRELVMVETATGKVLGSYAMPGTATGATPPGAEQACATASDLRPFGLGVRDGLVYAAITCTAESTQSAAQLRGYVYTFDPQTKTFGPKPVFELPMNYPHGYTGNGWDGIWKPWTPKSQYPGKNAYTQPMITDLVFDGGALILGVRDRFGDQSGEDPSSGEGVTAGDLLRACGTPATGWTLESNGVCGTSTGTGPKNGQGPGGGEFYWDGFATGTNHQEIMLGGVTQVPGFSDVVATTFDPTTTNGNDWRAGGTRKADAATGKTTSFFEIFDKCDSSGFARSDPKNPCTTPSGTGRFGKAAGLGDVAALCNLAPLEIGNRLWIDRNADGIQNAGEPSMPAGVTVELRDSKGTIVATTTTDASGTYAFNDGDVKGGLAQDTGYMVTVPLTQGALASYVPTQHVDDQPTRDSDGVPLPGGLWGTKLTTGGAGENDHTHDFGFTTPVSLGNLVWDDLNNDGLHTSGEPGIANVTVRLYADADRNGVPDDRDDDRDEGGSVTSTEPVATTTTNSEGSYLFTNLRPGSYVVELADLPAGYRSSTGGAACPYEGASTPSPNNDVNDDDNGTTVSAPGAPIVIRSKPVTLGIGTEPKGDGTTPGLTDPNPDADSNVTVDFGLWRPMSIGNVVWKDLNDDGLLGKGEAGYGGLTVSLYADTNADGVPDATAIATTTTDDAGRYLFTNLMPGAYVVGLTPPSGWSSSTGGASSSFEGASTPSPSTHVDGDDNGSFVVSRGEILTKTVTLLPGTAPTDETDKAVPGADPATDANADYTVDFGLHPALSLGNRVFADRNDDGVQSEDEPGVSGVPVRVYRDDNGDGVADGAAVASTVTNDGGWYLVTGLRPGKYVVSIEVPEGSRSSSDVVSTATPESSDLDDNGISKGTGTVTSGTVTLSYDGEPIGEPHDTFGLPDSAADSSGQYFVDFGLFTPKAGVTLKKYTNGWDAQEATGTTPPSGPDDARNNPVVAAGAGITWTYVVKNTGNTELTDVVVTDDRGVEVSCPATTVAVGASMTCSATGVAVAGQYANVGTVAARAETTPNTVAALPPATDPSHYFGAAPGLALKKYTLTKDAVGDADVAGGPDATVNHVLHVGDAVSWIYSVSNTGNVALDTITVTDDKVGAIRCPAATLAAGASMDCTASGTATEIGQYANIGTVVGTDRTTDPTSPRQLSASDPSHYFVASPAITLKKFTNGIDADTPADAVQVDAGSTVTWTYTMVNTGNVALTNVTLVDDHEGNITCPQSTLGVEERMTCTKTGTAKAGPYENSALITATDSTDAHRTVTAGDPSHYVGLAAAIGDHVWLDDNANGIFDDGEMPVANVVVKLYDAERNEVRVGPDGVLGTADDALGGMRTDEAGNYHFTALPPGSYHVGFTPPAGYVITSKGVGDNAAVDSDADPDTAMTGPTTLVANEDDVTWDLGLWRPASLGDTVWHDRNHNGVQDQGEPGVPGVRVTLFDVNGTTIATTTTDADGHYGFTGLKPGTYVVGFTPASGWFVTTSSVGNDHSVDSDADVVTGQTRPIVLRSGQNDPTIDAGLYQKASIGDLVWFDANHDGVQDAGEAGVADVVVKLLDAAGAVLATTTTDANGHYLFTGLEPGDYAIGFVVPAGYTVSPKNVGGSFADSDVDPQTGRTVVTHLGSGDDDRSWDLGIWNEPTRVLAVSESADPTPAATSPAAVTRLPSTGVAAASLLVLAASLLLAGGLLIGGTRRRRPTKVDR